MDFLSIPISFLFSLIEAVIFINILSAFRNKKDNNLKDSIIVLGISIIVFILTQLGVTPYIKVIIISSILFLSTFLYNLQQYQKILIVILYYLIIILSELLVTFLISNLLGVSIETLGINPYSYLFLGIFSKFIAILVISWVKRLFMNNKIILPQRFNYIIISILFVSTTSMLLLFYSSINLDKNHLLLYLFLIALFTLFSNLGVLSIYFYANTFYIELQKETSKRIYDKSYKKFILNAELKNEAISKIYHDIENHIRILEESTNFKGVSQKEYITSLKDRFKSIPNPINSGNRLVDIILNDKYSEASKRKINIDIKAIVPPELNIDNSDLSSILFNTIDNAIEASINSSVNKKFIYLELYNEGNFLCYKIKNSYDPYNNPTLNKSYGNKPYISRGYGLSIVKDIVNKYNGYMDIQKYCKEYLVTIVLPLSTKDNKTEIKKSKVRFLSKFP